MTDIDRQLSARRAIYRLLARMYLAPPDAALLEQLRGLPGLAEHVLEAPSSSKLPVSEALLVEYERLFGRTIYPYESIFRDRELMLNTMAADRVAALYQTYGVDTSWARAGAPDHLGLELAFMAELLAREAQALARADAPMAQRARLGQARCLREHLADWAPICALTLARVSAHPLYTALAALTIELLLGDLAAIHADGAAPNHAPIPLQPQRNDHERGLAQVVRQLLTPADVGVMITRADLHAIGRALGLPVPIGDREQMLRGLFESAGQFAQIPGLFDALGGLFAEAGTTLAELSDDYPAWGKYGAAWRRRVADGRALLQELLAQAAEHDAAPSPE